MHRHHYKVLDRLQEIGKDPVQPLQKYIADAERSRRRQRRLEQSVNETKLHPRSSRTDPQPNNNIACRKNKEGPIFHKFSELPIEVRLLIWEAICNTPQTIRVRTKSLWHETALLRYLIAFQGPEKGSFIPELDSPLYSCFFGAAATTPTKLDPLSPNDTLLSKSKVSKYI